MQKSILVKCGGFSSHLANIIGQQIDGDPLWSSRFDAENPKAVIKTHMDFLENGAQIILSNTYQSSIEGFMKHLNLSKDKSLELMRKSVQLAKEAKKCYLLKSNQTNVTGDGKLPLILASIGPYGAHLHDGSEYTGNYVEHIKAQDLQEWHRPRIEACLSEGVDGLAIETIPSQIEAEAVVDMVLEDYPGVKFWVSYQCKDRLTVAHGEPFSDAVISIWNKVKVKQAVDRLYGIGVNCVNPKFVASLLQSVRNKEPDTIPFIVYSNRGEIYNAQMGKWTGSEKCEPLESYVPEWIALGARIIGGCCRVYPDDILRLRKAIDSISAKI